MKTKTIVRSYRINAFVFVLAMASSVVFVCPLTQCAVMQGSDNIVLEEFRWSEPPVKVLLDMNQWSRPDYALAVHEALDEWVESIWNYTSAYNDSSLVKLNYVFYSSDINLTSNYDVLISFTPHSIPPDPNTVGLTTCTWDPVTHQPMPPITINITTNSATASSMFVKNIALHEFGHALGLGHASSQYTLNGPELMYHTSSRDSVVRPSTLDVYGLTRLYRGSYGQTVYLPPSIPYEMLVDGYIPGSWAPPTADFGEYIPLLMALFLVLVVAAAMISISRKDKPGENLDARAVLRVQKEALTKIHASHATLLFANL